MAETIVQEITTTIQGLKEGLKSYPIRDLVKHAEKFGSHLKQQRLETNQVRKFLDAINQLKAQLTQPDEIILQELNRIQNKAEQEKSQIKEQKDISSEDLLTKIKNIQKKADLEKGEIIFAQIEADVVLLKPKLAYASARQKAAKPLADVMSAAIDKVKSKEDFERLVQLIESIIAYHKAEGGK
ncbi:type III-A CRISPR-associated protein Csm2 [Aetokthonos hydrillicola Thurmond2011]|jgi:CRISPR-associated protein Csm2|uniref:CRISPR system Cms protein Csm2 n=1 Tax=Aetokthonos hydrillicola Thurmond2011 TaxID=2712845 RepID=A0AAP5M893_9CYAN|nr:type III-A CRISPR-associated protein Csm2 [Aetokthonos hydrillicola]MBO3464362.1 type III-A CRISPR-associated protein Csm2 [Aetokthonos hydrillicola CCALA 1050]MBW4590199.1 type III-A CRISPR-associated protein Csm2 [Aetokthonos hydrillicola CCALA 1050]MDR9893343.1 type III-A CRISPR-associated protein Csm2 [Aetokthonos hydrillicola Thurmond2011]